MSEHEGEIIDARERFGRSPVNSRLGSRVIESANLSQVIYLPKGSSEPLPPFDLLDLIDNTTRMIITALDNAGYEDESHWLVDTIRTQFRRGKNSTDIQVISREHLRSTDAGLYYELTRLRPTGIIPD